jgi:hypothetical protein
MSHPMCYSLLQIWGPISIDALQIYGRTDATEGRTRQVLKLKYWLGLTSLTLHYMNLYVMTMQQRTFSSSLI